MARFSAPSWNPCGGGSWRRAHSFVQDAVRHVVEVVATGPTMGPYFDPEDGSKLTVAWAAVTWTCLMVWQPSQDTLTWAIWFLIGLAKSVWFGR